MAYYRIEFFPCDPSGVSDAQYSTEVSAPSPGIALMKAFQRYRRSYGFSSRPDITHVCIWTSRTYKL